MNYNYLILVSLFFLWMPAPAHAELSGRLLLIYMTEDGEMNERVIMAEANLSAFVDSIDVVAAEEVRPDSVKTYQHIAFIGDTRELVSENVVQGLQHFTGTFLVYGHNAEQFLQFRDWTFEGEQRIGSVDGYSLDMVKTVEHFVPPKEADVLAEAKTIEQRIPFIAKNKNVAFVATTAFSTDEKHVLSRALYTIFNVRQPATHPAYIRLEGITPISKVKDVREAGEYLADRNIPFILSVTPVHLDSKTKEQVSLSANKKLVAELKSLQTRGGMVIVNGYNHSYRLNGMSDGHEFWDMELNQPIGSSPIDVLPTPVQASTRFPSDEEYSMYHETDLQAEADMIHTKHRLAIEELVELGLYPVGVDIPQYTMSANGYMVTSKYFSALFGRMQVSDADGRMLDAPLFISQPGRLSGMTLYPETIGYVDPDMPEPFEEMKHNIKRLQTVPGAVAGGRYHTYIGASYLPEMVRLMESLPGMQWMDFSEMNHDVQTPDIIVRHTAEGTQIVSKITTWQKWLNKVQKNPLNASLWVIVLVVALFLVAFTIYVFSLRLRLKKRLFEERDQLD